MKKDISKAFRNSVLCLCLSAAAGSAANAAMIGFWNYDSGNGMNSATGKIDLTAVNPDGITYTDGIYTSDGTGYLQGNGTNNTIANLPTGASAYTISSYVQTPTKANHGIVGWGKYGLSKQCNALRTFNGEYDDGTNPGFRHYWWGGDLTPVYNNTWNAHPFSEDWYHIVSTSNGTNQNLYINGQLIGSANPSGHNMQNQNFTIGSTNNNGKEILKGSMDNTSVYSHELSHGDVVNLTLAPNIGMTGWWVDSDTLSGNQKADRISGKVYSAALETAAKTVIKGNGNTMLFDRVLNTKENAYFTGQIAAGHTYQTDAEVSAWTNTNTAWVKTKSVTFDGSTTPLGIHVGGTTTAVTLTSSGTNMNKTNLVTVLPCGTLNITDKQTFNSTVYLNGGTLKGGDIRFANGGSLIMNSGKTEHTQLRLGHNGTAGSFVMNGGTADLSFLIMGENGSATNSLVTVDINGGTLNSTAVNNELSVGIVIGRGSKGIFNLNGGTVNASGVTTWTKGAVHLGHMTSGILNIKGGELNVSGDGLYVEREGSAVNQSSGIATVTGGKGITLVNKGAYNLTGGILNASVITNTESSFTQTGGKLSGTGETLTLNGNYTMNGGLLGTPLTVTGNAAVNPAPAAISTMTVNGTLTGTVLNSMWYDVTKNGTASVITPSDYSREMITEETYIWGGGTGNYDQANLNWIQNGAYVQTTPGTDSRVVIANGQTNVKTNAQAGEVYLSGAVMAYENATYGDGIRQIYVNQGGTLSVSHNTWINGTDVTIDGGTIKNGRYFTGFGSDTVLNSGTISVGELRVGNDGTEGTLTVNGGTVTTSWFTAGEKGEQAGAKSSVILNDGTITSSGGGTVMIGRGGKGELIINGGEFNVNSSSKNTNGSLNIGSHNESSAKITGGTLNVNGTSSKKGTAYGLYIGSEYDNAAWKSTFTQEGGTVNIGADSNIMLGTGGSYTMTGGTLNTPAIHGSTNENLILTGGLLSPGGKGAIGQTHVTGDITFGGTSAIEVSIAQLQEDIFASSDILLVDGDLTIDTLLTWDILDSLNSEDEYLILASKNPIQSDKYGSADAWALANAVNGFVLTVSQNPNLIDGYEYIVTARFDSPTDGSVPEPSAWILLVLGCGFLLKAGKGARAKS